MILALAIAGIVCGLVPAAMFFSNLPLFTPEVQGNEDEPESRASVSVLIPARDEAEGIALSIAAALASERVDVEVVVLDDHSTDDTAGIVKSMSESDTRVRYALGADLPAGWNGKQHACKQLAELAANSPLVFLDADVRLRPEALDRLTCYLNRSDAELISAFPHQETGTLLEKWIIPLMHYVLLGFLPMARMRDSNHPAYAAGCGQLFMTSAEAYRRAGTHEAIRESRHDGLKLPRAFRTAGMMTDVIDGTELADCRMYSSAGEVFRGVLKNASEGIANPRLIVPFSILLVGANVLPVITLIWSMIAQQWLAMLLSIAGVVIGHLPRAVAAIRFRQSVLGVVFHGPATLLFIGLQWVALLNHLSGRQVAWRGRTES